ncbi:MAG TPA: 3-phosphoshikimate 1-carboxyvinyltransferase [bacterium]|nr:3-phosphoshikimate 1-carboxyvinyltransferase [bacterium]
MTPSASLVVTPRSSLRGAVRVPGDKSISHRAALLGGLAAGTTTVDGFLRGDDCLATLACMQAMGVRVDDDGTRLVIHGGALTEPDQVLDVGNSGTTIRLLSGILAGQPFHSVVTGDASIRRRPMDRVATPLRRMGARISGRSGGRLAPLSIDGGGLRGIAYETPVASAQIKSAVLLAGLFADGETEVREPSQSRDHTERMLGAFGVPVRRDGLAVRMSGPAALRGTALRVPGDLSSAAFLLVAAALVPGSEVTVEDVGLNPTRTGVLDVLGLMGADVRVRGERDEGGEPVGDVTVRASRLRGVTIGGALIPRTIDELPVIAVAACLAEGETLIRDAAELRVKEVDRIAALARELGRLGAAVEPRPDGLAITGVARLRGGRVASGGDHRIAMAMAVAGLCADGPVTIDDPACIQTSFPEFEETLRGVTGT